MRALVVGCGHIGLKRARILRSMGVRLVLCEKNITLHKFLQAEFDCSVFSDAVSALVCQPDICLICTPPSSHLDLAIAAAQRGLRIFIEKPLADPRFDWSHIKILVETIRNASTWAKMGQSYRYCPSLRVFSNQVGELIAGDFWAGQNLADWHPDEDYKKSYSASSTEGGILFDSFSHALDTVNYLFGEIKSVYCKIGCTNSLGIDVSDFATCLLTMKSGAVMSVHCNYLQRPRTTAIRGIFDNIFDNNRYLQWCMQDDDSEQMLKNEMESLVQAVSKDFLPQPDIFQGIKILEILRACEESNRLGKEIIIENRWKELAGRK